MARLYVDLVPNTTPENTAKAFLCNMYQMTFPPYKLIEVKTPSAAQVEVRCPRSMKYYKIGKK